MNFLLFLQKRILFNQKWSLEGYSTFLGVGNPFLTPGDLINSTCVWLRQTANNTKQSSAKMRILCCMPDYWIIYLMDTNLLTVKVMHRHLLIFTEFNVWKYDWLVISYRVSPNQSYF
jgi:hypothetical protein